MTYLAPLDAAFLRMETKRTPMHVGALLTFKLPENAPRHYLRDLFNYMRSQPITTPPFNQRIVPSLMSKLMPAWEVAPRLDLDYHLRHSALPYPGGERELGVLVARLHSHPMDLTRPLWECHMIEGLENRRFAVYLKAHHSAVDGMRALKLIRNWLSQSPDEKSPPGPWAVKPKVRPEAAAASHDRPAPETNPFRHFASLAEDQINAAAELSRTMVRMSRRDENPEGGLLSALATPRTLFNAPVTAQRRLATQLFDLSRLKAIGQVTESTVNDVSLGIVGGAIRRYLLELNALPEMSLIASIPVGLPKMEGKGGNGVAGFVCPLSTNDPDPIKRLDLISTITARTKTQIRNMSPAALAQFTLVGISPLLMGQMTGLLARMPPIFNVVVSNVVGSTHKMYFCGAEMEAMFPVSVLFDGYALNVSIVGYADKLSIGFTGSRDVVPSLQRLAVYTGEALAELEKACGLDARPAPSAAETKARGGSKRKRSRRAESA